MAPQEQKIPVSPFVLELCQQAVPGQFLVDQLLRQAIMHCWQTLPEVDRMPEQLETKLFGLLHHALLDFREQLQREIESRSGNESSNKLEKIRVRYPRAYMAWTENEESQLRQLFGTGQEISELCGIFQRPPGAIRSRLRKMGLIADVRRSTGSVTTE